MDTELIEEGPLAPQSRRSAGSSRLGTLARVLLAALDVLLTRERTLGDLSEHLLRDVGLHSDEVERRR